MTNISSCLPPDCRTISCFHCFRYWFRWRRYSRMYPSLTILGGMWIMMGQQARSEALFYYFRMEDQVPETHLLRLIEKHISFAFVREKLKDSYSVTGRPSMADDSAS